MPWLFRRGRYPRSRLAVARCRPPSLTDRLNALGVKATAFLPLAEPCAAPALLGPLLPALVAELGAAWRARVEDQWRQRHEQVATSRAKLAAYDALGAEALDDEKLWEYARIVEELRGPDAAMIVGHAPHLDELVADLAAKEDTAVDSELEIATDLVATCLYMVYDPVSRRCLAASCSRASPRWSSTASLAMRRCSCASKAIRARS